MEITGITGNSFGIAPDPSHLAGGGYHCGIDDIKKIGKWTGSNVDYSVKLRRDRSVDGTNLSSAADWGGPWPKGGKSAWLRWNNALVAAKRANDPSLAALRAINFTPDGSARKRYDGEHPEMGIINSTDSVTIHTHLEWYRDTINSRAQCLTYILALANAAVNNLSLEEAMAGEADKAFSAKYTGTEPWISGDSWMAKAVEHPLTVLNTKVDTLLGDFTSLTDKITQALVDHPSVPVDTSNMADVKQAVKDAFREAFGA